MPRQFPARFKVAFSFAGEQRELVEQIATETEKLLGRESVFYDEWYEHVIAGYAATRELQDIYRNITDMVVVCMSGEYEAKRWTLAEYEAVDELMFKVRGNGRKADRLRILYLRFGAGEFKEMLANTICPDIRNRTAQETAQLIAGRLEEWQRSDPSRTPPLAALLITPASTPLAAVAVQVEDWFEAQNIEILRIDPTAGDEESRKRDIDEAVRKAGAVLDWIQTPAGDPDTIFCSVAREIREAATRAGKPVLCWLNPDTTVFSEADIQDPRTRRLPLESFKKEVLRELLSEPAPAAAAGPGHASWVVVAAAAEDHAAFDEIMVSLNAVSRPRDGQMDELHHAPEFSQTPDWDDVVKNALRRRKGQGGVIFIDGNCRRSWIDRRLRAYDVYREELPEGIRLVVWDKPAPAAKEPRYFQPDYALKVTAANALEVLDDLPS